MDRYLIVISDCHLSAGKNFEGRHNVHEDFAFDDEMVDFIDYFSTGEYGETSIGSTRRPVQVELVINGDYFDYLNVPVDGEFEDTITEAISLWKTEQIINGHPKVMDALRRFAAKPGKTIKYLIGNHDADLFFEKVRERITREWDPGQQYPSNIVEVIGTKDRIVYPEGVEIHHGNQHEAGSQLSFAEPFLKGGFGQQKLLNLPWSSFYVLKIVNRLKWERENLDKIRPVKVFVAFGLLLDPWFTLKFVFLSVFYFLQTRFVWSPKRQSSLKNTLNILKQESKLFLDLEKEARDYLNQNPQTNTVIFGHTHRPMNKVYPDGKQYINTGTWVRMVNLDWKSFGQQPTRTFAFVRFQNGKAEGELRQWMGLQRPHLVYDGF